MTSLAHAGNYFHNAKKVSPLAFQSVEALTVPERKYCHPIDKKSVSASWLWQCYDPPLRLQEYNTKVLKIPTCRMRTSWLLTNAAEELTLGLTRNQPREEERPWERGLPETTPK